MKGFKDLDKDYYISSCEEMEKATNYLFAYLDAVNYLEGNLPDEKENESKLKFFINRGLNSTFVAIRTINWGPDFSL